MLTRKQHELLMYIHQHLQHSGVSPSFDEMKDALNLRSKSGIHRLITGLEERGFIRRLAHRARALEVLRLPETALPRRNAAATSAVAPAPSPEVVAAPEGPPAGMAASPRRFEPNVIRGGAGNASISTGMPAGAVPVPSNDLLALPLYGRIAAGTPIEALRDYSRQVEVPGSFVGMGEHYALEVAGDSMVDAGILDGDTVIIQRCDVAENGSIVVALIDDQEATLKRLRRKGNSVALEAANPAYETRIFGPDRVRIQGRLVGLLRRY